VRLVIAYVLPRAYSRATKLSLVSCPIALSPATSTSQRVAFRQINTKTGNRLRQQLVDDETREPVDSEDRGKGYEIAKNEYVHVTDAELEEIQLESNHTIEIDRFVPATQIDKRFYDSGFYISPTDKPGIEAFAVIRDAMRGKGMVALGRVVLNKRERVIALEPHGKGLLAEEHFDATSPRSRCRARCSRSPSTSSTPRPATSIRTSSRTATRMRWSS